MNSRFTMMMMMMMILLFVSFEPHLLRLSLKREKKNKKLPFLLFYTGGGKKYFTPKIEMEKKMQMKKSSRSVCVSVSNENIKATIFTASTVVHKLWMKKKWQHCRHSCISMSDFDVEKKKCENTALSLC